MKFIDSRNFLFGFQIKSLAGVVRAPALLLLLLVLAACEPSLDDVKNTNDPFELGKIALNTSDEEVAKAVIAKLSDAEKAGHQYIERMGLRGKSDVTKAVAMEWLGDNLPKVKDNRVLKKIAAEGRDEKTKLSALVLYEPFYSKAEERKRIEAIANVEDIPLLLHLRGRTYGTKTREAVASRLLVLLQTEADQKLRADVLKATQGWANNSFGMTLEVAAQALGGINDDEILLDIAQTDDRQALQLFAVKGIDDQSVLAKLASAKNINGRVASAAAARVTVPQLLNDIVKSGKNYDARFVAIKRTTDQQVLLPLLELSAFQDEAKKRLGQLHKEALATSDPSQLADTAKTAAWYKTRIGALRKIKNPTVSLEVARSDRHADVRMEALGYVSGQKDLFQIAKSDSETDIRVAAVKRLKNRADLVTIAQSDVDYGVRLHAALLVFLLDNPDYSEDIKSIHRYAVELQAALLDKALIDHHGALKLTYNLQFYAAKYTNNNTLFVEQPKIAILNGKGEVLFKKDYSGRSHGEEYFGGSNGVKTTWAYIDVGEICRVLKTPLSEAQRAALLPSTRKCGAK